MMWIRSAEPLILLVRGCRYLLCIQYVSDLLVVVALCPHLKHSADDRCCIRINDRRTVRIITLEISERAVSTFILARLCIAFKNSTELLGCVCGIPLIKNIHDRQHIHRSTVAVECVNVVCQGNEAVIIHREQIIRVLTYLIVIASETGKVFTDDKVDLAVLGIV